LELTPLDQFHQKWDVAISTFHPLPQRLTPGPMRASSALLCRPASPVPALKFWQGCPGAEPGLIGGLGAEIA
jgi:hypothetical protein